MLRNFLGFTVGRGCCRIATGRIAGDCVVLVDQLLQVRVLVTGIDILAKIIIELSYADVKGLMSCC